MMKYDSSSIPRMHSICTRSFDDIEANDSIITKSVNDKMGN